MQGIVTSLLSALVYAMSAGSWVIYNKILDRVYDNILIPADFYCYYFYVYILSFIVIGITMVSIKSRGYILVSYTCSALSFASLIFLGLNNLNMLIPGS